MTSKIVGLRTILNYSELSALKSKVKNFACVKCGYMPEVGDEIKMLSNFAGKPLARNEGLRISYKTDSKRIPFFYCKKCWEKMQN